jgi:ergothioneine biosynthesis protein EgtB
MIGSHQQKSTERSLAERFAKVRRLSEQICVPLETEDYIPQPIVDVSPPKWHLAHTTWFFEEMILKPFSAGYRQFNEDYCFLFNSYYESVGERVVRDMRGALTRPTVKDVYAYRKHVDENMRGFFQAELSREVRDLVVLGLNHEQQHQELLLTDIKYSFSVNPTFPVYKADDVICEKGVIGANEFVPIPAGLYEIGFQGEGFCFDNELAPHKVYLQDFEIQRSPVTNGEFLEFIEDKGYETFNLWHSDGWEWVKNEHVNSPQYWHKMDGEWSHFTLGGLKKLDLNLPVSHVSFYEAFAFAEWKGCRLPTEFEWETAADKLDWGLRWEWTHSAYLPYPGFQRAAGAVGEYNGKFMINQMVLRGASVATSPWHSRKTYRNFFQPDLRWQYTGIRLAK